MGAMQGITPDGEASERELYVRISDADVHAARDAWWRAQGVDADSERTTTLYESYRQIVHAQAQQTAEEFRAARAR
jgi:hypothetical protein